MFADLSEAELKLWIENSLSESTHILASGLQGQTLKYDHPQHPLVIKIPHGKGLLRKFHVYMMRHEYNAYQKLVGLTSIPKCHGMVDKQYLVLDYIESVTIRSARPENETLYFKTLFSDIEKMHALGVAHTDLKKRDNLLVVGSDTPCIIDFGAAIIHKPGFHPLNHALFNMTRQFDYNAWIQHKYNHRLENISIDDQRFYRRTLLERVSRKIKRFYKDRLRKLWMRK